MVERTNSRWWLLRPDHELGYEIYPSADLAVDVYDALVRAGDDLGLVHAGHPVERALL